MEKQKQDLIIVKQLPIIEEQLKSLSNEIDTKVANALSLVVSDETVKDVKKVRADLNADFKELETQRKMVKEKVLAPYQQFEEVYKTYVSDKFKDADKQLKNKIDEVEEEQKRNKGIEVSEYFIEYAKSNDLDWLVEDGTYYQMANINVTLSASMKSLKEQAKNFVDMVVSDLALIETQEDKIEILVEYKKTLNVSNAITSVVNRKEALKKEIKIQEEVKELKEQEEKVVEKVDENLKSPVEEEKIYTMTFKVSGTMEQLKGIKKYLESAGVKYE